MKTRRLNQVIAAEKELKQTATMAVSEAHQIAQKPVLFNGFEKQYEPVEEGSGYSDVAL